MWIKVHVVTSLGTRNETTESYVNFDHVRVVSKSEKGCKIGMEDGTTFGLTESFDRIIATLEGRLDTGYQMPEPKLEGEQ